MQGQERGSGEGLESISEVQTDGVDTAIVSGLRAKGSGEFKEVRIAELDSEPASNQQHRVA